MTFEIVFEGLTVNNNAFIVKGFYDNDFQKIQRTERESLDRNNLKLEERYTTISSLRTITGFKEKLYNPDKLNLFIENVNKNYFVKINVNYFKLCY